MEELIFRFAKAAVFGAIAVFSAVYLGFPAIGALLLAGIVMILTSSNIMATFGYAGAVMLMVAATVWFLIGPEYRAMATQTVESVKTEISEQEPTRAGFAR